MARKSLRYAFCALALAVAGARASTVEVSVTDGSGKPAADAIVTLEALGDVPIPKSEIPAEGIIDQRNETFIPLVTVLRVGGRIVFTNNDTTMHQVYSFSPIKQFAFEIDQGHRSDAIVFDKPGVASIGCNIHDQMITYVFVADTPWAMQADATGTVRFADVPAGKYRLAAWHPRLLPGRPAPSTTVTVVGDTKLSISAPLSPATPSRHMHMGKY